MEKKCFYCKKLFKRNKNYCDEQWRKAKFCSSVCFGKHKKTIGFTHTKETRIKLSIAHKGTKKPWAGKYKHTKEHNENIKTSVRRTFLERGIEIRKKISAIHKGRKWTPEQRKKMEEVFKRSPNYRGGKETRKVRKAFNQRRREVVKRGNGGTHTIYQWENIKKECGYACLCCHRKEPEIKLTEDHILPICKGGSDNIENIQPLCNSCNSKKNKKTINYKNNQEVSVIDFPSKDV